MVAALIMARGYKADRFHRQAKSVRRDGRMPHRATAGCRADVIELPWNFH
jgi:hypothetical protein